MGNRQEVSTQMLEIAHMLELLQERLGRMESRMSQIESKLGAQGASDSRDVWATTTETVGAFGGVAVSGSNAPASVVLSRKEILLSPTDEQIVNLLRSRGAVCADDVQAHFKYKGKNAASARLNRLASLGLLERQQAGRRVYYRLCV
jgi:hypothetical protein